MPGTRISFGSSSTGARAGSKRPSGPGRNGTAGAAR